MEVGETTGLTQYWGIGVLLSMLASGLFLLKAFGPMRVMRAGMLVAALSFTGPIIVGITGNIGLFKGMVFVMGLGTGLAGAGMLSNAINFTTKIRAGMLLGDWAVANMTGKTLGSVMGGVIVDSIRILTGNIFMAYSTVFGLEIVILLVAFSLTFRLNMKTAKASLEERDKLFLAAAD